MQFAFAAAVFEGSLVAISIVLGWALGIRPLGTFRFNLLDAALGVVATVPLLAVFVFCLRSRLKPFRHITIILEERLIPLFRECSLIQLGILAALAGVGEEMLFRGVLQASIAETVGGQFGVWLGLLAAAVLFGLLHLITPTYAIFAGLVGLYLGGLWLFAGNLLAPIISHAVYDFVALWYLVRAKRDGTDAAERG